MGIKLKDQELIKEVRPFWDKTTIIIISITIGVPICFILINVISLFKPRGYSFNIGLEVGNSIALLTAGVAITGTIYSNYRNDIRNQKQINEAEKRLEKQLNKQDEHLKIQLNKQDKRLDTQIGSTEKNLKKQLSHNEEQLKTQLIFDKERSVMLKIYAIFYKNKLSIINDLESITPENNPRDFRDKWDRELNQVITRRKQIFEDLRLIRDDINQLYYIPLNIQEKIIDFISYTNKNIDKVDNPYGSYGVDRDKKIYYDDKDHLIEKYIKEIMELVESYIGIKIER